MGGGEEVSGGESVERDTEKGRREERQWCRGGVWRGKELE
jgi:hypothetical protein